MVSFDHLTLVLAAIFLPVTPPQATSVTGARQLVRLERAGAFLSGTPAQGVVARFLIYAPEAKPAEVVLGEREVDGGARLVQFSLPGELSSKFHDATLHLCVDPDATRVSLADGSRWTDLSPTGKPGEPAGYRTPRLGLFRITQSGAVVGSNLAKPGGFAVFETRLRFSRAFWHFFWPMVALAGSAAASRLLHRASSTRGR